jgi:ferric-dicitrate binding protein FerR (iron transport regulator)
MKHDRQPAERALSRVVAEARNESAPELDWARVEARIEENAAGVEPVATPSRGVRAVLLFAAASAALAVGWFAAGGQTPMASPVHTEVQRHALDGDRLSAGAAIEAPLEEVSIEHARHSRWTLERGSRANVTNVGGVVLVELERGALVAHVVPSPKKETFVVEVARTRVAVHGTAFRVALASDRVDVSVTEGTVLVGPREQPGWGEPLSAHESSSFTLDGAPLGEHALRVPAPRRQPERRPAAPAEHPPELTEQPSIDEVEKLVSRMLEVGATCFETRTATANGVRVTASTLFTLHALPEGRVELVSLDPPLAPPVQRCITEGVAKLMITPSQRGIQIARRMELER